MYVYVFFIYVKKIQMWIGRIQQYILRGRILVEEIVFQNLFEEMKGIKYRFKKFLKVKQENLKEIFIQIYYGEIV